MIAMQKVFKIDILVLLDDSKMVNEKRLVNANHPINISTEADGEHYAPLEFRWGRNGFIIMPRNWKEFRFLDKKTIAGHGVKSRS